LVKIIIMKKYFLLLTVAIAVLCSCKKSKIEEPAVVAFQWPAGTSDYAPHTLNSTFTFEIVSGTPAVTDSFTYTVVKDTTIPLGGVGLPFKKLQSNKPNLGPTYYANYNNGVVTNITYNVSLGGVNVPTIAQTILKDNVPVNATWNETITLTVSGFNVPIGFGYTIAQKDYTKNILAKDYANTIYVKQIISIDPQIAILAGIPATQQIDNYFGKGVGLLQRDAAGNNVKIKRYNIVK
jgi:hypothetical protein